MNAPRLIATIVVRDGLHVQSIEFNRYLPVGSPVESAREFDRWGIDEIALILLDNDPLGNCKLISAVSAAIAVPLAAIGGIRTISDARAYISGGADKFGLNNCLVDNPNLVREAAQVFGEQCVVASIDLVRKGNKLVRWDYWKKAPSDMEIEPWIRKVESLGAGEIFLNFPALDGTGLGMDLQAIQGAVDETSLPVACAGGIGITAHAVECFRLANPSGIGIGNRLAHFEHSILLFKKALMESGAPIRIGVKSSYADSATDSTGRPTKKNEDYLVELLFQRVEPEKI